MSYYTVERQFYLDRLNWTVDDATYSLADLQELLFKGVPQRDIIPKLSTSFASSTTVDAKIAAQAVLDAAAFITPATVDVKIAAQHTVDNSVYGRITEGPLNARRYGAVNDGVTDDSVAYQAAVNAVPIGGNIGNTILIDGPTRWNTGIVVSNRAGVKFQGTSGYTQYITPGAGLAGGTLLKYAIPSSIYVGAQLENIGIDMLNVAANAVEIQGGYNQYSLRNVFIMGINKANSGFRLVPSPGAPSGPVSQTLIAENCYAERTAGVTGCTAPLWLLEHINEGILIGCKGIGASNNDGGTAFQIKDCNGLNILLASPSQCSIGFDILTTVNAGAVGSERVVINHPCYENIGKPFQVKGNATFTVNRFSHLSPRIGGAPTTVSTIEYSLLAKLEMDNLPLVLNVASSQTRIFSDDDTQITDASGWSSNMIMGYPNAAVSYTQFNKRIRFPSAFAATASGNAALMIEVNDGAVTSVRQVSVGAADSGGVGYRMFRVLN